MLVLDFVVLQLQLQLVVVVVHLVHDLLLGVQLHVWLQFAVGRTGLLLLLLLLLLVVAVLQALNDLLHLHRNAFMD